MDRPRPCGNASLRAARTAAQAAQRPTGVVFYYAEGDPEPKAGYAQQVADAMFSSGPPVFGYTVEGYFLTQTFGAVDLIGSGKDIFGPYAVSAPKPGCPFNAWNNEATKQAAEKDGFNRSSYAQVVYVFENKPFEANPCSAAGIGGGEIAWINGLNSYTIVHELGHVLGAPHAATYRCLAADGTRVAYSASCSEVFPPGDEASEYGDPFDPMGSGRRGAFPLEMSAWRKLGFGAIPAGDAPTIAYSGTYAVAPLEQSSGTRLLRIANGAGDVFDLDFRQPIGPYDGNYPPDDPAVRGVAIHVDDPGFGIGVHPSRLLDTTPETPTFDDAPLTAGRQFRDFRTGVTIETVSVGASGATVKIGGLPNPPVAICKVPNLKRKKVKAAKKSIRKRDCKLGKVKRRHWRRVPKGKVVSQKPKAGKQVPAGTKIALVVSSGPPRS